jgi:uncharacterized protein YeeX (DUF496 family)
MALKIIKAADPIHIDQIVTTIYGPPGVGKSSLGFTANAGLLLDFDSGAYRTANRGDSVAIKNWSDVTGLTRDDLAPYRTIVIDTVGRALDAISADIIAREPKMGRAGALTLQGYGKLKAEFTAWLKLLRSFELDVVLLAHADEQRNGDETIERIDAQGGSKNEIYKVSDAMGRLAIREGKRVLLFSPTDTAFGKNPAGFEPLPVPHFDARSTFLGDVIHDIKAKLNELSEEQREVAGHLDAWSERVRTGTTTAKLNKLVGEIDALDSRIRDNAKRVLWQHAKDHGFSYDKTAHKFAGETATAEEPVREAVSA